MKIGVGGNRDAIAERLIGYCRKYPAEDVEIFPAGTQDADILLMEDDQIHEYEKMDLPKDSLRVVWTQDPDQKDDPARIFKYQAASHILSDIRERYAAWQASRPAPPVKTRIWLVSACERQAGATTVTEGIRRFLGRAGKRVLCWNMEAGGGPDTGCGDLYEAVLTGDENVCDKLDAAIQAGPDGSARIDDTLARMTAPSLSEEQMDRLLDALEEKKQWDVILIQGLDTFCGALKAVVGRADERLWIHCATPASAEGCAAYRRFAPIVFGETGPEEKIIYNMLDDTKSDLGGWPGAKVVGGILKQDMNGEKLFERISEMGMFAALLEDGTP